MSLRWGQEHVELASPDKDQGTLVSLGAWRYLEEEMDINATLDITNQKQNSQVRSLAPRYNSRVGSPAPKYNEQRKGAMLKTNLTETNGSLQLNTRFKEEEATKWGGQ